MGTGKQRNISLKPWITDAVQRLSDKEGKSFPAIINDLLTIQLEIEGYTEGAYIEKQRGREVTRGSEKESASKQA
jgi:hypothetical protein